MATTTQQIIQRNESDQAVSGLTWSNTKSTWISDDEVLSTPSESSTTVVDRSELEEEEEKQIGIISDEKVRVIWQEWESEDGLLDQGNPFHWSQGKKYRHTFIFISFTALVALVGSGYAVTQGSMLRDLGCSELLVTLGLSAYPLGFGLAPLVLSPFSETYGRYKIYFATAIVFTLSFIPQVLAERVWIVILFRFIGGCAGSSGSTLVGGSIADLFQTSNRGPAMNLFAILAFCGTGLGPVMLGYVEQSGLGWRIGLWIEMGMAGALSIIIILFTEETRGSAILSRRAAALRKSTGDDRYQCRSDSERSSLMVLIRVSISRPLYLLFTEPILASMSLYAMVAWGILYLCLEAVPLVLLSPYYGFPIGSVGLSFLTVILAALIGGLANIYQEKLYQRHFPTRGPEARLYSSMVGGLLIAAGCFIFGFTQQRTMWIGPLLGLLLLFLGIFTAYLAVFNYIADAYTVYASSALAAQSLCRNLAGFAFPLFTKELYVSLGYQWASFLAGMIALVLAMTPFVLYVYGARIRDSSKFAKELAMMSNGL